MSQEEDYEEDYEEDEVVEGAPVMHHDSSTEYVDVDRLAGELPGGEGLVADRDDEVMGEGEEDDCDDDERFMMAMALENVERHGEEDESVEAFKSEDELEGQEHV